MRDGCFFSFFFTRSLEENLRNPVKMIQLCVVHHQKLKSPVFSIFGQGILEMMKGSPTVRGHTLTC